MADQSGFIHYQGKEILYIDYTQVTDTDTLRGRIARAEELLLGAGRKDLLELIDVTGSFAEQGMMELLKASATVTVPYVKRSVVVGVAGVKKVLLDFVTRVSGMRIETAQSLEAAKDLLTEERND